MKAAIATAYLPTVMAGLDPAIFSSLPARPKPMRNQEGSRVNPIVNGR
jgi:hypothetical protein